MARFSPTIVAALLLVPSGALFALAPTATAAPTYYDDTIISFDGTRLAATIFVPEGASNANKVPYVLMTHGWAGQRTSTPTGRVADLLAAGYGVVTWDSRGFGASGGEVMLNSPDHEVKDVSSIITHISIKVPSLRKVGSDPVIGMSGGSYAGGIQLLAAAFDSRIDVIAPEITWNDLAQSLAPNGVPKLYWTSLLFAGGLEASCVNARNGNPAGGATNTLTPLNQASSGCQTSDLARYYAEIHATNSISDEIRAELAYRSPKTYMSEIDIPTLLVQGFPDTLFDVNQAAANYEGIKANGAPVKLWLYDGGHGHYEPPAIPNTQGPLISATVVNWFDRHLKGDVNVDTGAEVQYYAGGAWRNATTWPDPAATARTNHQAGIPALMQGPVAGGTPSTFSYKLADGPTVLAGPASISFEATGNGLEGIVFVSLGVQDAAGAIAPANLQTQPVRFALEPGTGNYTAVSSDLVQVEANVPAGSSIVVTFSSTHRDYDANRVPGIVNVRNVHVGFTTV